MPIPPAESTMSPTAITLNKKQKRPPTTTPSSSDDYDEEDESESDDTFDGSKFNRGGFSSFFPIMFNFPGLPSSSRRGSSSSGPLGPITAIANSFSTGRTGAANAVATAYGGSPTNRSFKTFSLTLRGCY